MRTIESPQETPLSAAAMSDAARKLPATSIDRMTSETCQEAFAGDRTEMEAQAKLLAEQAGDPSIRVERVKAIQSTLADGTYQVSASDVAAKLMSRMLQK